VCCVLSLLRRRDVTHHITLKLESRHTITPHTEQDGYGSGRSHSLTHSFALTHSDQSVPSRKSRSADIALHPRRQSVVVVGL